MGVQNAVSQDVPNAKGADRALEKLDTTRDTKHAWDYLQIPLSATVLPPKGGTPTLGRQGPRALAAEAATCRARHRTGQAEALLAPPPLPHRECMRVATMCVGGHWANLLPTTQVCLWV